MKQTYVSSAGKKTKGKQRIPVKYIECPTKRKITFSKRKANIIKKVYELGILTGSQALVLIASNTGHIYTYSTKKFTPMLSDDGGKQLIETCLNTPDDDINRIFNTESMIQSPLLDSNNNSIDESNMSNSFIGQPDSPVKDDHLHFEGINSHVFSMRNPVNSDASNLSDSNKKIKMIHDMLDNYLQSSNYRNPDK